MGRWCGLWVVVLLGTGCAEPVRGTLAVHARSGQAYDFEPDECLDGGEFGYWGVQLRDDDGRVVDVFKRDDVPHAIVYAPGRLGFELTLDQCTVFEGRMTRRTVNGHAEMGGDLTIDCLDSEGNALAGDVSFTDCDCEDDD